LPGRCNEYGSDYKTEDIKLKTTNRRNFLKSGGLGVVATAAAAVTVQAKKTRASKDSLDGKRIAMVIDLQRCTGCGACVIGCKIENNVQEGVVWAKNVSRTTGKFPNVGFEVVPTLCNHCEKAPCVKICPTKAMHKGSGDITMHDSRKCIGCKSCMAACPYDVIRFNKRKVHAFWRDHKTLIKGCTSSAKDVVNKTGGIKVPYYNTSKEGTTGGEGVRYKGIVEKCTLCDHRVKKGKLPRCVELCPANARIAGDLNNRSSDVSKIISKYRPIRLKEILGTKPKVFYVRDFNPGNYTATKGKIYTLDNKTEARKDIL
jgi:molybdopterin-containing oxidoreductase family iron-sulfur binding subunit